LAQRKSNAIISRTAFPQKFMILSHRTNGHGYVLVQYFCANFQFLGRAPHNETA
jgi:hypothetical protein